MTHYYFRLLRFRWHGRSAPSLETLRALWWERTWPSVLVSLSWSPCFHLPKDGLCRGPSSWEWSSATGGTGPVIDRSHIILYGTHTHIHTYTHTHTHLVNVTVNNRKLSKVLSHKEHQPRRHRWVFVNVQHTLRLICVCGNAGLLNIIQCQNATIQTTLPGSVAFIFQVIRKSDNKITRLQSEVLFCTVPLESPRVKVTPSRKLGIPLHVLPLCMCACAHTYTIWIYSLW